MSGDHYQEQDDDGETEESFEEHVRAKLEEHDQNIQGLANNQDTIATNSEHTLEILKELVASIERLEQNM